MAFSSASRLLFIPLCPPSSFPYKPEFPKLPFSPPKVPHSLLAAASSHHQPPSPFTSEHSAVLDAVDANENSVPAVRTYENDLARLTLLGAVDFKQALTAAAADGGAAADEHISSGLNMVVETLFPGPSGDHSTVATRLSLPSRKVKEKAIQLKKKLLTKEIISGTTSNHILAMTFRQVVIERLQILEMALFKPGTERNMSDLENPTEVPVLLTLSSSDERVISSIGEVICAAAFEDIEGHFRHDSSWFDKKKRVSSRDCSVVLYNLLEHEAVANSKMLLEKFKLERGKYELKGSKLKNSWWSSNAFSKLEKIGGPEFCVWISEFLPTYVLEMDSDKFSDLEFEGWRKTDENIWEAALTHSQMVSLAEILDMYYEDVFTLPNKGLSCYAVARPSNLNLNKGSSFLKTLSIVVASGIFLVMISVLGKICLPRQPIRNKFIQKYSQAPFSEINCVPHHSVDFFELEMCFVSIIRRIKNYFGWPGEISNKTGVCAWVGEVPKFLKEVDKTDSSMLDVSSTSTPLAASDEEMKAVEDIASYQVVVTRDGSIVGFQPTNRVAVNNWAANPLAKGLHGGKNLSPGLLEPGVKFSRPSDVLALELLISLNPKSYFAMVRGVGVSEEVS
ncbi:hypothetical protein PHJA_001898700 [Phtheirospermum japonicum]|uniref:Uncharacterized protein n=1 Tax=Phtheirospermum japonicum TaxID=374723 RepID=A0A830CEB3_9LAMI|nr:hypothetical protein PHJA_001898700 [Phtheirospermum japonicum]